MGDACHQTPPFLGQGLCAGIRDAANLAWKLALVLRCGAHDGLLDTYALERKAHVRTLVATAKSLGEIVGELDFEQARQRDIALRDQLERGEVETTRQKIIPDLQDGVIDAGEAGGTLFVQPHVAADGSGFVLLDDLLQQHRFLLATRSPEPLSWLDERARAVWDRLGGERAVIGPRADGADSAAPGVLNLAERDGLFAGWMERHSCVAAVVRPDRYVFGVASDADSLNRLVHALEDLMFD